MNLALLELVGDDRDAARAALAHEIGHVLQKKLNLVRDASIVRVEGHADAIAAQLLERSGFGGAETVRAAWQRVFGCQSIRESLGQDVGDHPGDGVRWSSTFSLGEAYEHLQRRPGAAVEFDVPGWTSGVG